MKVIGYTIYRHKLLVFIFNDASDVLIQALAPFCGDEVLPALDGKNHMNIKLGVRIGHSSKFGCGCLDVGFRRLGLKGEYRPAGATNLLLRFSVNLSPLRGSFAGWIPACFWLPCLHSFNGNTALKT
jgi:hypothetical protein